MTSIEIVRDGKKIPKKLGTKRVLRPKRPLDSVSRGFTNFGTPYPPSADVSFRYVDYFACTPALGAIATYQFSANGMFDPDINGGGHQPLGYDQWLGTSATTGFYGQYLVVRSTITVTLVSKGTLGPGEFVLMLGLSDDTTVGTSFSAMMENPTFKHTFVGESGSGYSIRSLTHKYDACKYWGLSREALYARSDIMGFSSANPTQFVNYTVVTAAADPSTTPSTPSLIVSIEYQAHLTERRELLSS